MVQQQDGGVASGWILRATDACVKQIANTLTRNDVKSFAVRTWSLGFFARRSEQMPMQSLYFRRRILLMAYLTVGKDIHQQIVCVRTGSQPTPFGDRKQ